MRLARWQRHLGISALESVQIVQVASGGTYLLLACAQCLPLIGDEFGTLHNRQALHISTCKTFLREAYIGLRWLLYSSIIFDGGSVCWALLLRSLEQFPQSTARIVGEADLVGGVAMDPVGVRFRIRRCMLVREVIIMLRITWSDQDATWQDGQDQRAAYLFLRRRKALHLVGGFFEPSC